MIDVSYFCYHSLQMYSFDQHPRENTYMEEVEKDGYHFTGELELHQLVLEFEGNKEKQVSHEKG